MPKHVSFPILIFLLLALACQSKERVLATVQGKEVTQAEFDAYLRVKHQPAADPKRRDAAFDEYLQREGLASVIEKEPGLDKAAIDAELADVRREILISRYMDRFLENKVSDAAVKSYYDAHTKEYEQHKVHASHILVRTNTKMSDSEKAARLTAANDLKAKLDGGANFEELARSSSDDKISGAQGGDLGWLREGSIDPEFSRRAFSQAPGAVSEPFVTPFGYHLLKVLEAPRVVRRPYQAVLGEIRYQLRNEAKAAELKRLQGLLKIQKKSEYKLDPKAAAAASSQNARPTTPPPPREPAEPFGSEPLIRPDPREPPSAATTAVASPPRAPSAASLEPKAPTTKKTTPGAHGGAPHVPPVAAPHPTPPAAAPPAAAPPAAPAPPAQPPAPTE